MSISAALDRGLTALGSPLTDSAPPRLAQYLSLLAKWNRTYNLTAIREASKLVSHHILDSLAVLPHLHCTSIVDVGSGAGLPGIPIAIARPDWRVALLDSNHKKGAFLRQVAVELRLENIQVVTERAESWEPIEKFEVVISRAFSDLVGFVDAGRHLCSESGRLVAMKGIYPDEELALLPADVRVEEVVPVQVPGLRAARHLVLLRTFNQA
jgi:16S rRNA (guanine527-N7)-methyltransferase